jgi:hypothetical protein
MMASKPREMRRKRLFRQAVTSRFPLWKKGTEGDSRARAPANALESPGLRERGGVFPKAISAWFHPAEARA